MTPFDRAEIFAQNFVASVLLEMLLKEDIKDPQTIEQIAFIATQLHSPLEA